MSNVIYLHQLITNKQRVDTDYSGRDEDEEFLEDRDEDLEDDEELLEDDELYEEE